jgi:hypothetical protein
MNSPSVISEVIISAMKSSPTRSPLALFLDDERFPPKDGRSWVIVRTVAAAVAWVKKNGVPSHLSFDNDLQNRVEGRHFALWLVRTDAESGGKFLPHDFSWYVHSQNSVNGVDDQLRHWMLNRDQPRLSRLHR